tara:strand:- start:20227 stop:20748 length:522 start_codon:yes stop_codon:yes gene_type:complete
MQGDYVGCMNRRFFTFGLGALMGAPKVGLAGITPMSSATASHMKLATMISRAHDYCSPEFLMRHLKVDKGIAAQVQQALIQNNVITRPSATGFSYAVDPMPFSRLSNSMPAQTNELVQKVKDKVSDHLATGKSDKPDDGEAQADDPVPACHRDVEEIPSDLVTAGDRCGKDLV